MEKKYIIGVIAWVFHKLKDINAISVYRTLYPDLQQLWVEML